MEIKKSEFKKLYDVACNDWKKKFDEMFKNSLFSDTLNFENNFIEQMKSACNEKQLKIFNEIFKDFINENSLFEKIKTYRDVCKHLNEPEWELDDISLGTKKDRIKQLAFLKLKQIERCFNGTWMTDFDDENQYKYYPYFRKEFSGLVFYDSFCYYCYFNVSVAFFKDKKTSDYVGKTFIDIYKNLI